MPTEFFYPISDSSNNWPQSPAWSRVDDDIAHGGSDDGLALATTSVTAADAKCGLKQLQGPAVVGVSEVKPHAEADAGLPVAVARFAAWTGTSNAGAIEWVAPISRVAKIGSAVLDPDTGLDWTLAVINALEAHFYDTPSFPHARNIYWGHLDIDTIQGSFGGGEVFGACWWPPLVAALGGLILRYESVERIQQVLNDVWGCRGIRPLLRNREEREIVFAELARQPRFCFLR